MGRPLPSWAHPAVYLALRSAMTVPLLAGCPASMAGAAAVGRRFAQAGFNRGRLERATANIQMAIPELDDDAARELAIKAYEHLLELATEICFMPRFLNEDGWSRHVELVNIVPALGELIRKNPVLFLTGHLGNWEIMGLINSLLGFPAYALYRPLDNKPLDRWIRQTRGKRGLQLIDKFGAAMDVPKLLTNSATVGIVADQNAGDRGMHVPFLGRLASSYKLIGIMAIRANATIVVGAAHRVRVGDAPAQETLPGVPQLDPSKARGLCYRGEIYDVIRPEDWADQPDPLFYVTARYRRAIEQIILSCPEQYLWMHRIWKSRPRHEVRGQPFPPALRDKLRALPWMTDDELAKIVEQSDRDTRWLAEHNTDRLP